MNKSFIKFAAKRQSLIRVAVCAASLLPVSCSDSRQQLTQSTPAPHGGGVWFRQAVVDLGAHIQMRSPTIGFATSRGRGTDVPGRAYRFSAGRWNPILQYPYSDSPLIAARDSQSVWIVNHLVHAGNCRPVFRARTLAGVNELPLPRVMWDRTDFVMMKGIARLGDRGWMVGQQGHILSFDGEVWKESLSPLVHAGHANAYEGDLNDICMLSDHLGWAAGRNGAILQYQNGAWRKRPSPTRNDLLHISMADERHGWIVGENGTVLQWDGVQWSVVPIGVHTNLNSVRAMDASHAWIVGNNSTLLVYDGKNWSKDETIKAYDDIFQDVSVVTDGDGRLSVWIIGDQGIYTNAQSLGFSFTDVTGPLGLRRTGRGGMFFDRRGDGFPDLLVLGDESPNLLLANNHGIGFSDATLDAGLNSDGALSLTAAVGDINNDGSPDLFEISDQTSARVYLGSGVRFRTGSDDVQFRPVDRTPIAGIAARLADFDNDGNVDLYISAGDADDVLFRNNGNGVFTDVFDSSGITKLLKHRSFGATFGDFNNDGKVDIVIPYWISENGKFIDLFLNDGGFKFHAIRDSSFFSQENIAPTVCIAADLNNDDNLDLVVHCQGGPPMLLYNDGHAHFTNVSARVGFTSPIFMPDPTNGILAAGDVNNDGWLDLFIASKLFLNDHGRRFNEVSEQSGVQFTGHPTFSDIDDDGDLDLFLGSSQKSLGKGDRAAMFRNNLNDGNFIKVRVRGDVSNRDAIGAKVFVDGETTSSHQLRVIGLGSNPMLEQYLSEAHFGVQPNERYTVRVAFPSGRERTMTGIPPGHVVEVAESPALLRAAVLANKSLLRTAGTLRWPADVLKFMAAIMLILGFVFGGSKLGLSAVVRRWHIAAGGVLAYALLLHLSIDAGQMSSTIVSLGGLAIGGTFILAVGRVVVRKRESQYISHYKLLEVLGEGGMGRVYRARDLHSKEIVAVKVLNDGLLSDPENRRRLTSEGQLLAAFSHPHIVRVHEFGESEGRGFIVMEYLSGGTLKQLLQAKHPLPIPELQRLLLQIADGMLAVHSRGIVHRDLKTGNVMLDDELNVRIMDFGLSKSPLVTTMTTLGTVLGTLGYVAPEQITNQQVDERTDIFSLGVLIYELFTNELPFKGENEIALIHAIFSTTPTAPSQIRPDVPSLVDRIVERCIAKSPADRYNSVKEVIAALHMLPSQSNFL